MESHECMTLVNRDNFGPATLFRVYPEGVDTFQVKEAEMHDVEFHDILLQHNAFNRKVFDFVHQEGMAGRGVIISLTDCYRYTDYGEPILALKSFILSPFVDENNVEAVVNKVLEARKLLTFPN